MSTDPIPQPVPTQWTLTRKDGSAVPTPIEASLAAETLGVHAHDRDNLPDRLDEYTWMLNTPYVVVAKLATDGQVGITNNGYSADAEWPDHVPVPNPTFDDAEPACEWRVAGCDGSTCEGCAPDAEEAESCCPACGEPISYCQGHGESGDPDGFAVLQLHDRGDHTSCHPDGCEFLDLLQATIEDDGVQGVAALLATPPQVWVVEQVTHGDHEPDDSGESCTDECVGELALATWYPSQIRACYVADELQRQTFTSHRASLLVLDPENPSLPM